MNGRYSSEALTRALDELRQEWGFRRPSISASRLGAFVSNAVFLVDRLAETKDPLSGVLGDPLDTLEQIYAVALDREWSDLPAEEESMARAAISAVVSFTKSMPPSE